MSEASYQGQLVAMDVGDSSSESDDVPPPVPSLENIGRICCIGGGRVGILSMMVLSHYWHNKDFIVLDRNADIINDLNGVNDANERSIHFTEPTGDYLDAAIIDRGNLHFSSDIDAELDLCQMVFIAVDIPLKTKPKVIKNDLDIKNFEDAMESVLKSIVRTNEWKLVAVKSTIPVDYNSHIFNHIQGFGTHLLSMITNPEFFSVGTAVQDLLHPPKVVLGSFFQSENALVLFRDLYEGVVDDVDDIEIIHSHSSVQIGKLLSNAVLAAQLTVMNIGSTLCEKVGSNFDDVKSTISAHPRMNESFMNSRPGYGGLGLTKDVNYLAYLCDYVGMTNERKFFTMLNEMRATKMDELVQNISHRIGDSKNIAIFGFANKVNTDDIRESPAIYICRSLLKINDVKLKIYDPWVVEAAILRCFTVRQRDRIKVVENITAAWDVEAMVLLLEYPIFAFMLQNEEQRQEMINTMRRPSVIFDCCDLIADANGFEHVQIYRLGKPI